jgi:hypothetical protein
MRRHAAAMAKLTDAVMAFDDDRVAGAAVALLADPEVVRPMSVQAAALDVKLPPRFHELEALLDAKTEALLAAAQVHDGERLTAADAELAWTCAQCHSAFDGP